MKNPRLPEARQLPLEQMVARQQEINRDLSSAEVLADPERLATLSRELSELSPFVQHYQAYLSAGEELDTAGALREDADPEIRQLAAQEHAELTERIAAAVEALELLFTPPVEDDRRAAFVEIRAGTGGAEAALFAAALLRMYCRYCELERWETELISGSRHELGGWKEAVLAVHASGAYRRLRLESGIHRVQRIPETESRGRIHTSACSVAVLPQLDKSEIIELNRAELRIDTYRASGAGGQHVNKTDSAVRITHLPSGLIVECQQERSQLQNRERAMALLQARLQDRHEQERQQAVVEQRRDMVGSGDRAEKIRTYNFPQSRVTDHRIELSLHNLPLIMDGKLAPLLDALEAA